MFKNILVPIDVDYADRSGIMLQKAIYLIDEGGKITVTYVIEDVPGVLTEALPDELVAKAAHEAHGRLTEMVRVAGMKADVQIRSGRPAKAITELAEDLNADLVLMESRRPGPRHYLLGSTAADVVRHARCAVLVARDPA